MKKKIISLTLFFLLKSHFFNAQTEVYNVESISMNKVIPNTVIVPKNYNAKGKPVPVLYLLHGAGGNFKTWINISSDIKIFADQNNVLVVCPDGGANSWYFDSPIDKKVQYETYISKELVAAIDTKFNTVKNPSGRAIAGLSMGGHGAFYLAFKHQDTWGAAGSTSGGLDLRPFPNNWEISKRLGTYSENKEAWEKNSVINLIYLLDGKSQKLIFDCGIDDFFYDANRRVHEKLLERNIPHDFIVRPGKHNKDYWENSIKYQLLYFADYFLKTSSLKD